LVFNDDPSLNRAIVYETSSVGEPIIYAKIKGIKESNHQVVVLLLDLHRLPIK